LVNTYYKEERRSERSVNFVRKREVERSGTGDRGEFNIGEGMT